MTNDRRWHLDMTAGPIFLQIANNVRAMLARGELSAGDRLPSARDLAQRLGVNPNTVVHAFAELDRLEISVTKRGLGTFVREDAPIMEMRDEMLRDAAVAFAEEIRRLGARPVEALSVLEEVLNAGDDA